MALGYEVDPNGPGRPMGRPMYFGPTDRPLFGWLHLPPTDEVTRAVVVCPPIGDGYHEAYASLRILCERLATAGCAALRLDYDGTGDSAGDQCDPGRAQAWPRSVRHAITWLTERTQAPVVLVGMRLGAAMAALAAEEAPVDGLVLWDPVTSGRAFIAEQKTLLALSIGPSLGDDGLVHLPEMVMTTEAAEELRRTDITKGTSRLAERTLVLTRAGTRPRRLVDRLDGPSTQWEEATGQEDLMEAGSAYGAIAYDAINRVATWVTSLPGAALPWADGPVTSSARVTAGTDDKRLEERPVQLGPARLFAIVTEPGPAPPGPTVIFLNTASGSHVGGERLWVELSRRWAALGLRCARLDLSGLGDSAVRHPAQARNLHSCVEAMDDVLDACAALEPQDPSNVVLVGLCTGGYQVLESGLEVRPRAVVSINPAISFSPPERAGGGRISPRRRLLVPRRALASAYYSAHYGEEAPTGLLHRYRGLGPLLRSIAAPRHPGARKARDWQRRAVTFVTLRLRSLVKPSRRPRNWLNALTTGGTEVVLVCCEEDLRPLLVGLGRSGLAPWRGRGLLHLPISDHMLRIPHEREAVLDAITARWEAKFGLSGSAAPGAPAVGAPLE